MSLFDAAEEQRRCQVAADALAVGDVYLAAAALYGVQNRCAHEWLRRKAAMEALADLAEDE